MRIQREKNEIHPVYPFFKEAQMSHDLEDCSVFHYVKGFDKIQFKNDDLPLALLALMYKFKAPCNTILYSSRFDKAILIFM